MALADGGLRRGAKPVPLEAHVCRVGGDMCRVGAGGDVGGGALRGSPGGVTTGEGTIPGGGTPGAALPVAPCLSVRFGADVT